MQDKKDGFNGRPTRVWLGRKYLGRYGIPDRPADGRRNTALFR